MKQDAVAATDAARIPDARVRGSVTIDEVSTTFGVRRSAAAVIACVAPSMLGMHLSVTHSIIHLVTGAVSLWLGLKGSPSAAKNFCIVFGLVYLGLGVAGFVAGANAEPGVPGPHDARMLKVIPGQFEVGTADHVVHILLGAIYLIAGLMTRTVRAVAARV